MKTITYTFSARGDYQPDAPAVFGEQTHLKLIVTPHDFELKLSGDVLRKSSCDGYQIVVSRQGEACFYDAGGELIARAAPTDAQYPQVVLTWAQHALKLSFGQWVTVDYYPNCDGESDRWGSKWESQKEVSLDLKTFKLS